MEIILNGLPKFSLNEWYSGIHWSKRKKLKDRYHWLVKSQFKHVFNREKKYHVSYGFHFEKNPLDASNTGAMLKLIEDIIFGVDKYDIVLDIHIYSRKAKEDYVLIYITDNYLDFIIYLQKLQPHF